MAAQWLSLYLPAQGGTGVISGQAAKISRASWPKKNKNMEQKQCCDKFHKNFKERMVHIKKENLKKKKVESSSILDEAWTLRD